MRLGIKGEIVMSAYLEDMLTCFTLKETPPLWLKTKIGYLSLMPLTSWFNDFILRLKFIQGWVDKAPASFWISSFFFPQGFFTSVKQQYARKTKTPIDSLEFDTEFKGYYVEDAEKNPPSENGVIIHGAFLEGCRWNAKDKLLDESHKGILFVPGPCIDVYPQIIDEFDLGPRYMCPMYKSTMR